MQWLQKASMHSCYTHVARVWGWFQLVGIVTGLILTQTAILLRKSVPGWWLSAHNDVFFQSQGCRYTETPLYYHAFNFPEWVFMVEFYIVWIGWKKSCIFLHLMRNFFPVLLFFFFFFLLLRNRPFFAQYSALFWSKTRLTIFRLFSCVFLFWVAEVHADSALVCQHKKTEDERRKSRVAF